jgi:hypothetical protein
MIPSRRKSLNRESLNRKHFAMQPFNDVTLHASFAWLPSQNGAFFVCLQPHHATVLAPAISVFNGAKPELLCAPSQNGWLLDLPHAHQK